MLTLTEVAEILRAATWTFAKTRAAYNPHYYTVRESWEDGDLFTQLVHYIQHHGEVEYFATRLYLCVNVDGRKYWTMGKEPHLSQLINMKVLDASGESADGTVRMVAPVRRWTP